MKGLVIVRAWEKANQAIPSGRVATRFHFALGRGHKALPGGDIHKASNLKSMIKYSLVEVINSFHP